MDSLSQFVEQECDIGPDIKYPASRLYEVHGEVQHPGDFMAQCEYAYEKLRTVLAKNGASLGDIVKQTTYVTDVRHQSLAGQCRTQAYTGFKLLAHTFLTVSGFAWPMMLVELDVIAIAPLQTN